MNILLPTNFLQKGIILVFNFFFVRTTDEVEQRWCLSSHGEFLGILRYNFAIFWSMRRSPTRVLFITIYREVLNYCRSVI